jgi:hypothetical protein
VISSRDAGAPAAGFGLVVIITAPTAQAQDSLSRPLKIITNSAPGSAVDVILRHR